MSEHHKIDPELGTFLATMRAGWAEHPPFDTLSFPEQRAVAETVRAGFAKGGPVMARTIEETFRSSNGEMRVRVHLPAGLDGAAPALVYLHGGGFTLFSIDTHDRLMREYASAGGFAVVGLDYPLSPEAKFPAALDLVTDFMLWLDTHGAGWGLDSRRIAIGGDSAGGNLAFAICLRLRAMGRIGLARAILSNYGCFTASITDDSDARFGGPGSIMDRAEVVQYYANYLRSDADAHDPQACPILADLAGFPPVFLVIPELDVIAEQSFAMERQLRAFDVDTTVKLYPGAIHSFLEAMSISALAREAIADGAAFVKQRLT